MSSAQEARAYQLGAGDGIDAANADAPTPECNAGTVLGRAWIAATDQALRSQVEREEYFIGWTHGYVGRAEGIEDAERDREARSGLVYGPDLCSASGDTQTDLPRRGSLSTSLLMAGESAPRLPEAGG